MTTALVAVTAETIIANNLNGSFVAWNSRDSTFQKMYVPRNFVPRYEKTISTFATALRTGAYRRWTEPEIERLIELRSRKLLWREIAAELERGKKQCSGYYLIICERRGIEPVLTTALRHKMTDEDKTRALKMRDMKIDRRKISTVLGVSQAALGLFFSAHSARQRLERLRQATDAPQTPRRVDRAIARTITTNSRLKPVQVVPGSDNAMATLRAMVCDYFMIPVDVFLRGGRDKRLVRARHIFYYLARKHTGKSYPQIARFGGNLDHTTVMHGCGKIQDDPGEYGEEIAALEKACGLAATGE